MAYESAVYLRVTTVWGETIVNLVMSKILIAPVKRVTLPWKSFMENSVESRADIRAVVKILSHL
ncbi:hypothetical protein T4E_5653 [Trichinella pseudospiralis]|uniref:Uncharacterized protein n=1 Tax=Trichinella pseudospiralis TaxID=6337 RepID=A0A0V0YKV2_TRIPS|nr:hypothetical protein T4E_5653 [Trichinella pseudospiralis]